MTEGPVRLIAFYLPQYHPIPENDAWWGKGFTEWSNVARARPLFPSHYQPHIPADLGFYDLRLPEAREAQAGLAREHGIYGFCYHHYWFSGKRLLEYPFDQVLASGKPDFPFCLCWANEPWARTWDGRDGDTLMGQTYSEDDDLRHIRWLANALRDPRYIRVGDKPLLLIYRANRLPEPKRTSTVWREEARQLGLGELFLGRVESFPDERGDPRAIGFDAAIEFQPDGANLGPRLADPVYRDHEVYDYGSFMERQLHKPDPPYTRFPCVMPGWDNSPRRPGFARIFDRSTPAAYEKWLCGAIRKAERLAPSEKIVFVNAWNEWGEGDHLEPDLVYGRKYLEATRRAVSAAPENATPPLGTTKDQQEEKPDGVTQVEESGPGRTDRDLERTVRALEGMVSEQQVVIDRQEAVVHAYGELERWAHELQDASREQQATIHNYQLLLRPFSPFIRIARLLGIGRAKRR